MSPSPRHRVPRTQLHRNPPATEKAARFGEYAIALDRSQSHDLGRRFPAAGQLRAIKFETGRPIKYGASIGQALQTLRLLDPADEHMLDAALADICKGEPAPHAKSCGLWTKCDSVFADYFLKNWSRRHEPLAFLLYDPPPALRTGAPVFIQSDKNLRLVARFRAGQFVAGYVNSGLRLAHFGGPCRAVRWNIFSPQLPSASGEGQLRRKNVRAGWAGFWPRFWYTF